MTIDWQVPLIVIGSIVVIAFFIGRPKVEVEPEFGFEEPEASRELDFAPDLEPGNAPDFAPDLEPGFAPDLQPGFAPELEPGNAQDLDPGFAPDLDPGFAPDLEPFGTLSGPDLVDRLQHTLGIGILVESVEPTEPATILATFMSGQHTTRATVTGATEADAWQELAKAAVAWRNSDFQHLPMWWGGAG